MSKRDELIALIDAYAHHVRGWQRIDPTYREKVLAALDAALTPLVCPVCNGRGEVETGIGMMDCDECHGAAPPAQTPLSEFQEGQWWLQELDAMAKEPDQGCGGGSQFDAFSTNTTSTADRF